MKKIKLNAFAVLIAAAGMLTACSSETTTGVDSGDVNTDNQNNMGNQNNMDTTNTETYPDTSYQNPPTQQDAGTRDQ